MELRGYQRDALDLTLRAIPHDRHILIQMATGAGKTIFFSELIRTLLTRWPSIRIGVLAHRRELIGQAQDKLLRVWPEAPIGIACASTGESIDTDSPVTIGSIQTMSRRVAETAPYDLIIVDEAHRIPPINQQSQYLDWLVAMTKYNPATRILGVTATPYRLGHGYIYGDACKPGNENLFSKLHYSISIKDLQQLGYLCAYRAKEAKRMDSELQSVKRNGDYQIGELSDLMSRAEHVSSAVKAVERHAEDRHRIVVFCVTIDHAERVCAAFRSAGIAANVVHSQMHLRLRDMTLAAFEAGRIRVLCNVMVLSEGWDSPAVDCVTMCRPTLSSALYVQMTGRGLRPHKDKTDVLILDLAGNCAKHGDPNDPVVAVPSGKITGGGAPSKTCPNCTELVPANTKRCPACEYQWPEEVLEAKYNGMKDVHFGAPEPMTAAVVGWTCEAMESKAGNPMLKVTLRCQIGDSIRPEFVNHFFMFDGHPFAVEKSIRTWEHLTGTPAPKDREEAYDRHGELLMSIPDKIQIIKKDKWWNVHRWKVAEE